MAKTGLGRGLGALIGGGKHSASTSALAAPQPAIEKGEMIQRVALDLIAPSPFQPRKTFNEEKLDELVSSVKELGIMQPLIVRRAGGKRFELIAGERRLRAAQKAELKEVPVIVRTANDREVLELALTENLQRADLNPIDEAEGYALLMKKFDLTQDEVAQRMGKNRAAVANAVRLLQLTDDMRSLVVRGQLSVGHAKVILSLEGEQEQNILAERIQRDHMTVRQAEKMAATLQASVPRKAKPGANPSARPPMSDAALTDLEKRLQHALGTRVRIAGTADSGKIEVDYFSADDLERLLRQLGVSEF